MKISEYNIENTPEPKKMKRLGIIREWKSIFQVGRLCLNYNSLVKEKQGRGQRIILFPGYMSTESSMFPVKHFLKRVGYAPEYWGLGFNRGKVEEYRDAMIEKLLSEDDDGKVDLVGWSLGGVVAREVARIIPEKINSLFIFGSPIKGPKYTVGSEVYGEEETQRITNLLEELEDSKPIDIPTSILFSKKDNIVSWPSCIDSSNDNVRHYEVSSTHLSMGIDPQVWNLLALHLKEFLKD